MSLAMMANVALVGLNVLLAAVLLAVYARMLRALPARLTWGLVLFAGVLLVQGLVQLYFFVTMMELYAGGVEGLVLAQNAMATLALGFLSYVTLFPEGAAASSPPPADA